jgi:hypothetical protein
MINSSPSLPKNRLRTLAEIYLVLMHALPHALAFEKFPVTMRVTATVTLAAPSEFDLHEGRTVT